MSSSRGDNVTQFVFSCFCVFVPFFFFIVFGVLSAFEIWKVSERYLGGIWGLSRRCMEGLEFGGFRYPKKFGTKIFLEQSFSWTQNFLGPKIFLDLKFSSTQNFLWPKIFLDLNFIEPQIFLDPKFSDQSNFWNTHFF